MYLKSMATKVCSKCKQRKKTSEFYRHSKSPDGFETACKQCRYTRLQLWRLNNPGRTRQIDEAYRQRSRPKKRVTNREFYQSHKVYYKAANKKRRARIRGTWKQFFEIAWLGIRSRTKTAETNPRNVCYRNIKCLCSKEEFRCWCEQRKELIEWMYAEGLRPSIDRKNSSSHYIVSNLRIIPLSINIQLGGIESHKRKKSQASKSKV